MSTSMSRPVPFLQPFSPLGGLDSRSVSASQVAFCFDPAHKRASESKASFSGKAATLLFWFGLIILLALQSGCSETTAAPTPPLAEVRYTELLGEDIILTRELPGRVSAFTVSEVRPQVGGIVQARLFEEGADVVAGQVLYRIDPVLYEAAFNNARANLARVQANEEATRLLAARYDKLVKTNAVSRQERDDALAAYNQSKAEIDAFREALETARINLGYTRVTAPVSGRIGRSSVTEGALVTQNQEAPLAVVQQISPVYVDVSQSNAQLLRLRRALSSGRIKAGGPDSAKVRLYLEDGSAYTRGAMEHSENAHQSAPESQEWIEGELLFSDIMVDQSTGAVSIRARFDNPDGLLLPGMYVRAVLEEGLLENAILIPQKSVTRDAQNRPQVHVLTRATGSDTGEAYRVEARSITIDRDYRNKWLVSSGLAPGELLLVDGVQKVRAGQTVSATRLPNADSAKALASRGSENQRR